MIIGITGSIGCGKTTVAKIFGRHRYNRIDVDEVGHKIIKKNFIAYEKIIKEFGSSILDKNKNIERKKLGDLVFSNNKNIKKLNSIMHPLIIKNIKNQINKIKNKCKDKTKIVIDAPLLLETKNKYLVEKIIVVKCNKENVIKRLAKKYPKEKIEKILNVQMPLSGKLRYADVVIDNNKDLSYLKHQIEKVIQELNKI